jgi:hypothetical protein
MAGRTYAENRPYLLPETLGELAGPVTGVVQLPLRLDWSERTEFHLDDPAERNVMYERVIREATRVEDLRSYLNEDILRQVWGQLFLPARVRRSWEDRFPGLRLAAIDRLPDSLFQPYDMSPEDASMLRERMRAWARRISTAH